MLSETEFVYFALSVVVDMEQNLKLVEYSDSDSEPEETVNVQVTQQGCVPVRDSQGGQVAVVEPTPQNVAVIHPMESHSGGDGEDLEGTGIFEPQVDYPLSTQATQGSSSPNQLNPYFVSPEITKFLEIEIPRDNLDVIVISDSSQDTIIISELGV